MEVQAQVPHAPAPQAPAPHAQAPQAPAPHAQAPLQHAQAPQAPALQSKAPQAPAPQAPAPQAQAPQAPAPQSKASTRHREAGKAKNNPRHVRGVSASLTKSRNFQKKKRKKAGATPPSAKTPGEQDENLEEPFGLGCIVIRSCQRFNNIRCFSIVFCILLLSQGEPEGLGRGEGSRATPSGCLGGGGKRGMVVQLEAAVLSNVVKV